MSSRRDCHSTENNLHLALNLLRSIRFESNRINLAARTPREVYLISTKPNLRQSGHCNSARTIMGKHRTALHVGIYECS